MRWSELGERTVGARHDTLRGAGLLEPLEVLLRSCYYKRTWVVWGGWERGGWSDTCSNAAGSEMLGGVLWW
eukprot:GDKH01016595.1.p2 GENE.GDKH01016595.1~~GDKH01016595.1.p2  ORF type:complete len:71 (-),score=1.69 GDKH01016595.1:157-369(-)